MNRFAGVAVLLLLLAGCDEPAPPQQPPLIQSDRPVLGPDDTPPYEGIVVHPDSQVVRGGPISWEWAQISPTGSTLRIGYTGGNEGCYGLDRVLVVSRPEFIVLTVFEGSERGFLRAPGPAVCTLEAVTKVTSVALHESLAGRPVLDGTCLISLTRGCPGDSSHEIASPQET